MDKKKLTKSKGKKSSKDKKPKSKHKKPTSKEFNDARLELKKMIEFLSSEELTPSAPRKATAGSRAWRRRRLRSRTAPAWTNSSSISSEKKSTQKIEELEKHIEGLERKISLLSKLVIYHGPGEKHPKRKWGNGSFNGIMEIFPKEGLRYYNDICNEVRGPKVKTLEFLKEQHKETGEKPRPDDITLKELDEFEQMYKRNY